MVVDVIDIRKRIQRIRNDVSDALIARHEPQPYEEQLSPDAELSVLPAEICTFNSKKGSIDIGCFGSINVLDVLYS